MQMIAVSAVLAGCAFWIQRLLLLTSFGWKFTDEDQSLLAFTLRELQSGSIHGPTFYGQTYGNWIESAVAALFTPSSLSPSITLPLATQLIFWLPFTALALKEWKSGRRILANLLLWIPCLLPHRADLIFSLPRAWIPGASLVMLGATLLRSSPAALGVSLVCACTLNSASAILALPVLIEALLRKRHDRAWILRLMNGLGLGCLHPLLIAIWSRLHPSWSIHPSPGWSWSLPRMIDGIRNLDVLAGSMLPVFLGLVAAALLLGQLKTPARLALLTVGALMLGSLGLEKLGDGSLSVFFPYDRAFVALPFAGGWLLWLSLEAPKPSRANRLGNKLGITLVISALAATLIFKEWTRTESIQSEIARSGASVVAPRLVSDLEQICERAENEARLAGVHWVVFQQDRAAAYACGALWHGRLETIHPPYERRQWLQERFSAADSISVGEPRRE